MPAGAARTKDPALRAVAVGDGQQPIRTVELTAADAGDEAAVSSARSPRRLMRIMAQLQDDIARGSTAALTAQRVLGNRIAEIFATSPPEVWTEPANARALFAYALSGADPGVLRRLAGTELPAPYDRLLDAALAYAEGRQEDALSHFEAVTVERLPRAVRGPAALALAALVVSNDTERAQAYLALARLSAPGTLVEEAALRREVLLAAETDDLAAFQRLSNRYLRKFRSSVYAGNFRRRLAAAVTRMRFITKPGAYDELAPVLKPMTPGSRRELHLTIARAAVENGNRGAALLAAEQALSASAAETLDHRRARLYRAAAQVVDPAAFRAAVAELEILRDTELPADDRALLTAALQLSLSVAELPDANGSAAVPFGPSVPAALDRGTIVAAEPQPESDAPAVSSEAALETVGTDDAAAFAPAAALEQRVASALAEIDRILEE